MKKRFFLYGGAILWTLALFIVLGDRMVTEHVPLLAEVWNRWAVILLVNVALAFVVRRIFVRRRTARAGAA